MKLKHDLDMLTLFNK